jgi:hypothetical protein
MERWMVTIRRLALIPLPALAAGPSIEVSPFVEVRLHLAASADADARVSMVAPFRLGSGFAFDGSLRAGMSSSPRHEPEVGLPDTTVALVGSVELEIVLALLITIQDIPVGGPVIGTSLGTIIGVDPIAGVAVNGEVEIVGGWAFPGLDGFPDIPRTCAHCTHSSGSTSRSGVIHSPPARRLPGGRACSTSTRTTAQRPFRPTPARPSSRTAGIPGWHRWTAPVYPSGRVRRLTHGIRRAWSTPSMATSWSRGSPVPAFGSTGSPRPGNRGGPAR